MAVTPHPSSPPFFFLTHSLWSVPLPGPVTCGVAIDQAGRTGCPFNSQAAELDGATRPPGPGDTALRTVPPGKAQREWPYHFTNHRGTCRPIGP